METPFYHDDSPTVPSFSQMADFERYPGHKMLMSKKPAASPAGLHLGAGGRHGNPNNLVPAGSASLMASATPAEDLNLLKLTSPDLEHLMVQSNQGLAAACPASAANSPFVYRNQATNEQEGFADGFVKALADLHKQNQLVGSSHASPSPPSTSSLQASYQRNLMPGGEMPVYTNLGSYNPGAVAYSGVAVAYGGHAHGGAGPPPHHLRGLDTPQTVPEGPYPPGDPPGSPPSLSPIDLETQERIKAERKKLRNRIAASKCRKRKLERISRLEEKVKALKSQNSELASTAAMLREQVVHLKQKVMSHVTNGCQIAVGLTSAAKAGGGGAGNEDDC